MRFIQRRAAEAGHEPDLQASRSGRVFEGVHDRRTVKAPEKSERSFESNFESSFESSFEIWAQYESGFEQQIRSLCSI